MRLCSSKFDGNIRVCRGLLSLLLLLVNWKYEYEGVKWLEYDIANSS